MKKLFLILMYITVYQTIIAQQPGISSSDAGKTTAKTMTSRFLGEERAYSIYLPKDYDTNTGKKYPVFYLLHGAGDDNKCYETKAGLASIVNQLIATGEVTDMIIVTPNAGGVQNEGYYNMEGYSYEEFFFTEFMPYIETTYRIIGDKNHRAIGGLSMGGGGSTVYALMHPELFCAVYEMSGALAISEVSPLYRQTKVPGDLASRKITGYLTHNCAEMVTKATDAQKAEYRSILWYVDCGDDDFTLQWNLSFYKAMLDAKIPCQLRVRDGGHTWAYWTSGLYLALPLVSVRFASN